ncbi:MAG: hypothetical protein A07HR67_02468 [uncultured archaeon A07HR67]|nr:MAG: hypothetical protein A07HR67_02468 [uncultured archaeon A07HR67]
MNRQRLLLVLAIVLLTVTASGTHGATTVALDRTTATDIVDQDSGLLAVSQATTGFNTTTNRADLTVTATNQLTLTIDKINISVDGTTRTAKRVSPGATVSVSFTSVDCAATVVIEYDTESITQRAERQIDCG